MKVNVERLEVLFSQVKILDLASEQIALVQDGDRYIGLCPFKSHEDLTFSVDREQTVVSQQDPKYLLIALSANYTNARTYFTAP